MYINILYNSLFVKNFLLVAVLRPASPPARGPRNDVRRRHCEAISFFADKNTKTALILNKTMVINVL